MIWVVVLVAAIVIPAGALALKLRPRPGAQIVLATAYLRALRTTNDKKESLRRALTVLRNRPLFADLRDEDITFLAELFEDCRHPQVALGQVVHLAESRRSPRRLQDHDSLRALVAGHGKKVPNRHRQRTVYPFSSLLSSSRDIHGAADEVTQVRAVPERSIAQNKYEMGAHSALFSIGQWRVSSRFYCRQTSGMVGRRARYDRTFRPKAQRPPRMCGKQDQRACSEFVHEQYDSTFP